MALRKDIIGFDRRLESKWLDKTAFLVADGLTPSEVKNSLRESFEDCTSDALRKTISLLMGIWSTVPEEVKPLRNSGISLFLDAEDYERKILHYFMTITNYPFFYDVCMFSGRLLNTTDVFNSKQTISRVQEKWGERSTTIRAVQRSLNTILNWGWLIDAKKGNYLEIPDKIKDSIPGKFHGFVAASILLGSLRSSIELIELENNPCLFPFHLNFNIYELKISQHINLNNRGNETIVSLK